MALNFFQKITRAVAGKSRVDDDTLDNIEEALIESDMGVDTTLKIIDNLEERVAKDKMMSFDELVGYLAKTWKQSRCPSADEWINCSTPKQRNITQC